VKKPAIPSITAGADNTDRVLRALKENVELINGTRTGTLDQLGSNASVDDIVNKINEIVDRLNVK
jgi:hypothetical protein